MRGKVDEELKKHFKPEFLNRVDEIIVFPQLQRRGAAADRGPVHQAPRRPDARPRHDRSSSRVAAKEQLIKVGFDPTLGARPLRRAIQREVEDRLSERILQGELNAGDHVHVDFSDGEFVFTTSRQPGREEIDALEAVESGELADSR